MSIVSATGPYTRAQRIIITIPVLMASLLHALNMSTAYVALPSIQGNLSATPNQIGWIITAFVVASAIGTVLTGWLSERFGRRVVFLGSIAGFTVTSALCVSAANLEALVFYRILQGLASAPLLPFLSRSFTESLRRRDDLGASSAASADLMAPTATELGTERSDNAGSRRRSGPCRTPRRARGEAVRRQRGDSTSPRHR